MTRKFLERRDYRKIIKCEKNGGENVTHSSGITLFGRGLERFFFFGKEKRKGGRSFGWRKVIFGGGNRTEKETEIRSVRGPRVREKEEDGLQGRDETGSQPSNLFHVSLPPSSVNDPIR